MGIGMGSLDSSWYAFIRRVALGGGQPWIFGQSILFIETTQVLYSMRSNSNTAKTTTPQPETVFTHSLNSTRHRRLPTAPRVFVSLIYHQVYLKSAAPSMTFSPLSALRFARINRGQVMSVNTPASKIKAPVATRPGT